MRTPLVAATVLLCAIGLAGCGDDDPDVASDPTVSASPSTSPSTSPSASPTPSLPTTDPTSRSDTQQTCVDLYHPPAQVLPRAIEFVHGNETDDPVAEAEDLVTRLSAIAGTAEPMLAGDIAIVRISVDTQRAIAQSDTDVQQDLKSFDASVRRLGKACSTYGE